MKYFEQDTIVSPITYLDNVKLSKEYSLNFIVDQYQNRYLIDARKFFLGNEKILKYRCVESGFEFFHPNFEGDNEFYQELQRDPYYYLPWKWEHEILFSKIRKNDKVLEFGCGQGFFLDKLKQSEINCCGVEKNLATIKMCQAKNHNVFKNLEFLEGAKDFRKFSVICSFQVMEHVYDVRSLLEKMISFLAEDGRLFISVPNNDSFIKNDEKNILNLPPHHLGFWTEESLRNLEKFFDIKTENFYYEPLPINHIRYYYEVMIGRLLKKNNFKRRLMNVVLILPACLVIYIFRKKIKGTTIIAEYKLKKKDEKK